MSINGNHAFTPWAQSLILALSSTLATATPSTPVAPRDAALDMLDCRTLLRLGGDDRAYTLLYFHGFVSGKTGLVRLETDTMAKATDGILDHCIDHPSENLLKVFETVRAGHKVD